MVCASRVRLFLLVTSIMGSISETSGYFAASYRISKAAVNMLGATLIHDPAIAAVNGKVLLVHPGWVDTDMGRSGGSSPPLSIPQSTKGTLRLINLSTAVQLGDACHN